MALQPYQREFVNFLVTSGALSFGDFTLKSGRKAPYFINTGKFESGEHIAQLGKYYASRIAALGPGQIDVVFGPAYKGIPLAVTASIALYTEHGQSLYYCFDRKEAKDHGDAGTLVGHKLRDGERVIIVEDVITAGTTVREIVPMLKSIAQIKIAGMVISVNRCERGSGGLSAVQEVEQSMGIPVYPIVTIHDLVEHLSQDNPSGLKLDAAMLQRIAEYLKEYGAV